MNHSNLEGVSAWASVGVRDGLRLAKEHGAGTFPITDTSCPRHLLSPIAEVPMEFDETRPRPPVLKINGRLNPRTAAWEKATHSSKEIRGLLLLDLAIAHDFVRARPSKNHHYEATRNQQGPLSASQGTCPVHRRIIGTLELSAQHRG